jgi:hypothetical protein
MKETVLLTSMKKVTIAHFFANYLILKGKVFLRNLKRQNRQNKSFIFSLVTTGKKWMDEWSIYQLIMIFSQKLLANVSNVRYSNV